MTISRARNRFRREEGTSILEFVLVLPSLVFVMVLLISLGHALVLRQHALVAARYAAFALSVSGDGPSDDAVSRAVAKQNERWQLRREGWDEGSNILASIGGGSDVVGSLFLSAVDSIRSREDGHYKAKHILGDGLAMRTFRLTEAEAEYTLPTGSWTSNECGVFLPLLLDEIKIGPVTIKP
jgi:hypothetical protein